MTKEDSGGQHSPARDRDRQLLGLSTASSFLTEQTAAADARLCCAAQVLTTGLSLTPASGICSHFAKNQAAWKLFVLVY